MRSHPASRNRIGINVTAGLRRVMQGAFGIGSPDEKNQVPSGPSPLYHFHPGDIFLPGTGNWVLDPSYETPMQTQWGHGTLGPYNIFSPIQFGQVATYPTAKVTGLGGVTAGQILTQPLSDPETA